MSTYKKFRSSNAWNTTYNLPLVPRHNNPFLYAAYAYKIMKLKGLKRIEAQSLETNFTQYRDLCEIEPGLYDRHPNGTGGVTSHDELMGLAYISEFNAQYILSYLYRHLGYYCNKPEEAAKVSLPFFHYNIFRMIWMLPFLTASAGKLVNPLYQLMACFYLVYDALAYKGKDEGGRLRIWIMLEALSKPWLIRWAVKFWKYKMHKLGLSPKLMYNHYLKECPAFKENAPEEF